MSDHSPHCNDCAGLSERSANSPSASGIVERLRLRMLVEHGGPTGFEHGWNLMRDDSELHRDAIAEIEQLLEVVRSGAALRERLAGLLTRTAVALRGPEPQLTQWSWHDLPERAAAAMACLDASTREALMAAEDLKSTNTTHPAHSQGQSIHDGGS